MITANGRTPLRAGPTTAASGLILAASNSRTKIESTFNGMLEHKQLKQAYIVLGYVCNEQCKCCPCSERQSSDPLVGWDELRGSLENAISHDVTDIVFSGGEPTLSPHFFQAIEYALDRGRKAHILSNSEKFSDRHFADKLIGLSSTGLVSVTTTFHSHLQSKHEEQNGSTGSFERSLRGLKYLDANGVDVAVKHCVTRLNYKNLCTFLDFIDAEFSDNVEAQFWGLDLDSLSTMQSWEYYVNPTMLKPHLERMLDHAENKPCFSRVLTINNIPLCTCDCYYWPYFSAPHALQYEYVSTINDGTSRPNAYPFCGICRFCDFSTICQGTYISVADRFGSEVACFPTVETIINHVPQLYNRYVDGQSLALISFSPYGKVRIQKNGLQFINTANDYELTLRLRANEAFCLVSSLSRGINPDDLIALLNGLTGIFDADSVVKTLLYYGVLE